MAHSWECELSSALAFLFLKKIEALGEPTLECCQGALRAFPSSLVCLPRLVESSCFFLRGMSLFLL